MDTTALASGNRLLTIRPLVAGDRAVVGRLFDGLGDRSRQQRFGGAKTELSPRELDRLSQVDRDHYALVAYPAGTSVPIGIAQLVRDDDDPAVAEVAFAVVDTWQARGVGTALMRRLADEARLFGILRLRASIRPDNRASLALMHRTTEVEDVRLGHGELEVLGRAA